MEYWQQNVTIVYLTIVCNTISLSLNFYFSFCSLWISFYLCGTVIIIIYFKIPQRIMISTSWGDLGVDLIRDLPWFCKSGLSLLFGVFKSRFDTPSVTLVSLAEHILWTYPMPTDFSMVTVLFQKRVRNRQIKKPCSFIQCFSHKLFVAFKEQSRVIQSDVLSRDTGTSVDSDKYDNIRSFWLEYYSGCMRNFYHPQRTYSCMSFSSRRGWRRSLSQHAPQVKWPGGLCSGGLSLGVSVQGSLCPGGSLSRWSLSRGVSVWGSLSRGSLSGGLCQWDLCPGGLCMGSLCLGCLCLGFSVWEVSVQRGLCLVGSLLGRPPPHCMVATGWYTSYWNAFLFMYFKVFRQNGNI